MAERVRRGTSWWPIAVTALGLGLAAAGALLWAQRLPSGPEPVAWDRAACAHCHMHVGDAHFAAQLQTSEGDVLDFDDPGCLFAYLRERHPRLHAVYFHHVREDRWLRRDEVGFVPAARTPMGFGLAAVARTTPGAISVSEAEQAVARRVLTGGTP